MRTEKLTDFQEIDRANNIIVLAGGGPYTLFAGDNLRLRNEDVYPNEQVIVSKIGNFPEMDKHAVFCARCLAKTMR